MAVHYLDHVDFIAEPPPPPHFIKEGLELPKIESLVVGGVPKERGVKPEKGLM